MTAVVAEESPAGTEGKGARAAVKPTTHQHTSVWYVGEAESHAYPNTKAVEE